MNVKIYFLFSLFFYLLMGLLDHGYWLGSALGMNLLVGFLLMLQENQ